MSNYASGRRNFKPNFSKVSYNKQATQRAKKSGATFKIVRKTADNNVSSTDGMTAVSAWVKTRAGMIKIFACGYATTRTSEHGNVFQKAVAEVLNVASGQVSKYPVLINVTKQRMTIKELGWCITANGHGVTSSGKRVKGAVVTIGK